MFSPTPTSVYPLASTIKIMILGVYAQGVAAGKYDPEERVALAELDAYYLPGTDGGAHPDFLKAVTPDEKRHDFALRKSSTA